MCCTQRQVSAFKEAPSLGSAFVRGWLLGSGGGVHTSARCTCCALLRQGPDALLIDAGTGVSRLVETPDLLDGADALTVVLTHFHLDHVVGLAYLPSIGFSGRVTVYGPGRYLYDTSTSDILSRAFESPFLSPAWGLGAFADEVAELSATQLTTEMFSVSTRVQRKHSHPTVALRVGRSLTYCTDTAFDSDNADFARGCEVLAHEAWSTSTSPEGVASHSSAREAASVAREAGAGKLVLIHVNPRANTDALLRDATDVFPATEVGADLMPLFPAVG